MVKSSLTTSSRKVTRPNERLYSAITQQWPSELAASPPRQRGVSLRALLKLAGLRPLTSKEVLHGLALVTLTARVRHKERSDPVARPLTREMERAARALLKANMPAHVIEQITGVTRNRLSRWLGARP